MAFLPGSRIGNYEIVASIGAGGMGEVYRARDTRLKREVALKVLPEALAADAERVARFQREAEVLGALNHPLIAHIYGLEETPSAAAGVPPTRAIVMELVEGEDLAERLQRGALPLDEALPIARQIAEALDAAHDQGIIHRDLKPANIKVRPDGTVKVLDFGLAKALEGAAATTGATSAEPLLNSPTITSPAMTVQGTILGTAAYMSPEQAKGRAADKRSDLWAFGCVLFEMLSGKRAFDGEDVSDTLALVLRGEPDWSALPPATPAAVRTLIQRCLDRDRRRRVASASTVLYLLHEPSLADADPERSAQLDAATLRQAVHVAVADARARLVRRWVVPSLALAALAVVAAGAGFWLRRGATAPGEVTRLTVSLPGGIGLPSGRGVLAIAPDGRHVAYVANFRLFVRALSEYDFREVAGGDAASGVQEPVFSPDGSALAFYAGGLLRRTPLSGGAATTVCAIEPPFGISWDATGLIVGQGRKGIVRCPANGGTAESLVTVAPDEQAHGPQLLPDGKTLIFTVAKLAQIGGSANRARWDNAQIVAQPLGSAERRVLVTGGSDAHYLPTGHLVYALAGTVFAVPFDATRLEVTAQPVPVVEGVMRTLVGLTGTAQFVTSATGTLAYLPGPARTSDERLLATATRDGVRTRLPVPPGPYQHVRASPDGTRLAVGSDDGREAIVWIYALDRSGPLQRLTVSGRNVYPIWAPDGRWLAMQSDREKDQAVFRVRDDGTGIERLTRPAEGESHTPESWSPDGRHLLYSVAKDGRFSLRALSLETRVATPFPGVDSEEPTCAVFSPDGKWVAYTMGVAGGVQTPNRGVYVQPFPPTGAMYQVPKVGLDFHPAWTRDGREIIWVPSASAAQHAVVAVTTGDGLRFGAPATFPARVTARQISSLRRVYDILPDGRLVGTFDPSETAFGDDAVGSEIRIVLNWFEELKRKAP